MIGEYQVAVNFPDEKHLTLHFTTTLKTNGDMMVPCCPRDIVTLQEKKVPDAEIHVSQVSARSGQLLPILIIIHKFLINSNLHIHGRNTFVCLILF